MWRYPVSCLSDSCGGDSMADRVTRALTGDWCTTDFTIWANHGAGCGGSTISCTRISRFTGMYRPRCSATSPGPPKRYGYEKRPEGPKPPMVWLSSFRNVRAGCACSKSRRRLSPRSIARLPRAGSNARASVVTSKPANGGHRKSGQWGWPGTVLFYPFEPVPGKPVLVRQLRGPHLRT